MKKRIKLELITVSDYHEEVFFNIPVHFIEAVRKVRTRHGLSIKETRELPEIQELQEIENKWVRENKGRTGQVKVDYNQLPYFLSDMDRLGILLHLIEEKYGIILDK